MKPEDRAEAISLELAESWQAPFTAEEIQAIADAIRQARADAYEECAKLVEQYGNSRKDRTPDNIAAAIRALSNKGEGG